MKFFPISPGTRDWRSAVCGVCLPLMCSEDLRMIKMLPSITSYLCLTIVSFSGFLFPVSDIIVIFPSPCKKKNEMFQMKTSEKKVDLNFMMQNQNLLSRESRGKGYMVYTNKKQVTESEHRFTGKEVNEYDMSLTVVFFVACNCWIGVTIDSTEATWKLSFTHLFSYNWGRTVKCYKKWSI